MKFYTNVAVWGGKILYRGVENGRRVKHRVDYFPSLFIPTSQESEYKTIYGENVGRIQKGDIKETREFVKRYEEVENFTIYGNRRYEYCFVADEFPDIIEWDVNGIRIANIDIEVGSEDGFPEPDLANGELTAITVKMDGVFTTFGCGDFQTSRNDVTYYKCDNEFDLIKRFIDWWTIDHPDIVTGWNIEGFDIPYLVNRISKLMGTDMARRLSPWGVINDKKKEYKGREYTTYTLLGTATLDLLELYRKYAPDGQSQESYSLDNIASVELGERKLSYEEYGSLHTLYKEDFQKFIEYNIKDVDLVDRIDEKHKFIELALTLSYDNKCNFQDVFQQVRMWDVICFNHLKAKKIVVPPLVTHSKDEAYVGAYVKEPLVGYHPFVASFDVNSEYPSVIMGSNISPETIVEPSDYNDDMRRIIASGVSVDKLLARSIDTSCLDTHNVCLTANGQFYRRDKQGFMPEMVEKMFADRKKYKKAMLDAEQELENEHDPERKTEIKKRVAKFKNLQLSKKVSLNSLYGALGSQYFRFFDIRHAIAITTTGQLSIRYIQNSINDYLNKVLKTDEDYVIAVDTDSVYLRLNGLVESTMGKSPDTTKAIAFMDKVCETKIQPIIDKACRDIGDYTNVYQQKIAMKREVLADKAIWTAKKRYILNVHNSEGVQYAKPKKKVMGLEMIKSSTPTACRVKLWDAVNLIFDEGEEAVQKFIQEFRAEFPNLPLADIASPRGCSGLTKYADSKTIWGFKTPFHVRGALVYNHQLKKHKLTNKYQTIKEGEKIKYVYLKEPNTVQSNVIAFPQGGIPEEFGLAPFIDYNTQFSKGFLEPLKIILDAIGWKTEKTASLEDFFS